MPGTPTVYKGDDAAIRITTATDTGTPLSHTDYAISDFSITFDKGTVEQELVGESGNYFIAGSMSVDISLTSCKLTQGAVIRIIKDMLDGKTVKISGSCGANSLNFYFFSAQVTGFDFSLGTADEITEGTVDFALLKPYKVSSLYFNTAGKSLLTDSATSADVDAASSYRGTTWRTASS